MNNQPHYISEEILSVEKVKEIIDKDLRLELSDAVKSEVIKCRVFLDKKIETSERSLYGINTGFGSLYNRNISPENLEKLQENLVKSHACGTGEEVPEKIVRIMLLLKIQSLSYGKSGIQLETLQRLVDFFNEKVHPIVYQQGSLGASGDLAPLAHLALPLMGQGEVMQQGKKLNGADLKWAPIHLKAKEGLALLNGTQFMSAYGVWLLINSQKLSDFADIIGAMSLDAFDGRIEPFNELIHKARPHQGQLDTATKIRTLLKGSEIISQTKKHVQDPYSFRCIPQVHGASKGAISHVKDVFSTEINSVTDNPNIFPDEDIIVSGGNFHGQPLAIALDYLCIALAELGNISERRTFQLILGNRNLPEFLVANSGLNSGLMIPQYTAASIVSQNKQLCTPSSVDSIVSSNGQEDHVSMGANAATKAYRIAQNLYTILAIELLIACQAMEFRRPLKTSPYLEKLLHNFRKNISFIENDRILHDDIQKAIVFLQHTDV